MNMRRTVLAVLICLLGCLWAEAQSQTAETSLPDAQRTAASLDPEDAFLSATRYTNAYFGFEFEIPAEGKLAPVPMPASRDRRIQLLELAGGAPQHAAISLFAYEYKGKNWTDAKGILRRELDQDLYTGVEELHGLSKTTIDGRQFYYFETRKGVEQHEELATELDGYVLLVVLEANDPQTLKLLTSAFYRLKFFPPPEAQQHAGVQAVVYEGPAVSSQRLRELKASPPAERMNPGKIDGNVYVNTQIGVRYEFPKGWNIEPQGAVEPAVLRYRERVSGEPNMGPRERDVVKACRRTLLSAWKTRPGADGEVPYDEFGEITLSAMPMECLPNMRFPDDPHDVDGVRRFLLGFSFSHPLQRDMNDARTFEAGGKTFVLTHGTIAYKEAGDELSRRISVAMVMTHHRGFLLVWLIAAPHDAELRELLSAKMGFDPDPATMEAKANAAGDPAKVTPPSGSLSPKPDSESPAASAPASAAENPSSKGQATENSAPPSAPADDATQFRPTLLKPGETMPAEQVQAKPLPKGPSQ
jgi:hypothetical protein